METTEIIETMYSAMEEAQDEAGKKFAAGKLIKELGSAAFIEAITKWFETSPVSVTEQYFESVGRRVQWQFPEGVMLTLGADINMTISNYIEKLTVSSPMLELLEPSNWTFLEHANGWTTHLFYDYETQVEIIETLASSHGIPKLLLPWQGWAESISEMEQEEYVWPDEDSEPETHREFLDVFRLMKLAKKDDLKFFSEWDIQLVFEEDYMNPYSDFSKYDQFVAELVDSKLVIADLEEHCGGCTGGFVEQAVERDPELRGKPFFVTFSQNSNLMVRPDGAIDIVAYCDEADTYTVEQIKIMASKAGVPCEWANGEFIFKSRDW